MMNEPAPSLGDTEDQENGAFCSGRWPPFSDQPAGDDAVAMLAPDDILDLTALGERFGSSPALRWHGLTVSYGAYARRVARIATALAEAGVRPDQRVALPAELDPPTWAATLFAILATGAVAVLLPARAVPRERARLLARTRAIEWQGGPARGAPRPAPVRIAIHRPATVVFTSGSSGAAKAVVHSTANHLYSAAGSAANIPLGPDDTWLVALPLSHVAGLSILFRTLGAGACALFAEGGAFRDADDPAARLLPAATQVSLVQTQLRRLLQLPRRQALSGRLRAALIGGSALSTSLLCQARDRGLPVCASYGCTEMASQVATTRPGDSDETFTAARILPYRKAAIAADGEILLGGRTLCLGYLDQERVRPAAGAGGWFASGDLGRIDGGRLSVTGRRDARFISGGENIQPEEVEQALLEHPTVLAAVCVAVPDPEFGSRPAAFLAVESGPLPPPDIAAHLDTRLARFKHPAHYYALPATPSGSAVSAAGDAIKHSRSALSALASRAISGSRP